MNDYRYPPGTGIGIVLILGALMWLVVFWWLMGNVTLPGWE